MKHYPISRIAVITGLVECENKCNSLTAKNPAYHFKPRRVAGSNGGYQVVAARYDGDESGIATNENI